MAHTETARDTSLRIDPAPEGHLAADENSAEPQKEASPIKCKIGDAGTAKAPHTRPENDATETELLSTRDATGSSHDC